MGAGDRLGRGDLLRLSAKGRKGCIKIGEPFTVLSGHGDRLTEAQTKGFVEAMISAPPLSLVGDQNDRPIMPSENVGENLVELGHADPGVDHEERDIAFPDRSLGLGAHPGLQTLVRDVLESRRIDELEIDVAQPTEAKPPVSGHARAVINDRQPPARQAVEKRGLADIGAADDGDAKGHLCRLADRDEPGLIGHEVDGVAHRDRPHGDGLAEVHGPLDLTGPGVHSNQLSGV